MKRRQFIQLTTAFAGIGILANACKKPRVIKSSIVGASSNVGHILREQKTFTPTKKNEIKTAIIGGGVSGLSAARWLYKNNQKDFVIFDLENKVGGNSRHGSNAISAYPYGAHYVPIANNDLKEYIDFLVETGSITGFENNLPIYNEEHLCSDPQERLYINGIWQDGLIPNFGINENDKKQIDLFFKMMNDFKTAIGKDNKQAFAIPLNESSKDENYTSFDSVTMKQWLQKNQLTSSYLHKYIDYCCNDDFGTNYNEISAWVGVHYFAARKGKAANATSGDVLTWCQGNGFLVEHLQKDFTKNNVTNCLATSVQIKENKVSIITLNTTNKECIEYVVDNCIVATPQYVNAKILPFATERNEIIKTNLQYTPWLVANLTVEKLEEKSGIGFSWDNVLHNSNSLGYVVASHQLVNQNKTLHNITYYFPLSEKQAKEARQDAHKKSIEDWQEIVFKDLENVHKNIREATSSFEVMLWGHSMAKPLPGVVTKNFRNVLQQSIDNKIHFAHTDLAGISIFEEAFYQGINAAKKVLAT